MSDTRKKDHIEQAFVSRPEFQLSSENIYYEPLFSAYPETGSELEFLDFNFEMPLWVSSMTGGTQKAFTINKNLARACKEFKLGMGLGSCRPLLDSNERLSDFDLREQIGDRPLYANLGIAQLENEFDQDRGARVVELVKKLNADGLIIHVNPLQEFFQPEGDKYKYPAIDTIKRAIDLLDFPLMVKEVGQGFGPRSIESLMALPLKAIELSAFGGTNFSLLEIKRSNQENCNQDFSYVGHTAEEMIEWINEFVLLDKSICKNIIISGGVTSALQGYILQQKLQAPSVVGMASQLLKYAQGDYEELRNYLSEVKKGFNMAQAFMRSSN